MNATPELVEETLQSLPDYVSMFTQAFPDEEQPVTFDNMAAAIEAFESTLVTPNEPFDQILEGEDDAMNDEEIQGLSLFMNKGGIACHSSISLRGQGYFSFGVIQ